MLTQHYLIDMNNYRETVAHSVSWLFLATPGYDRQSSASQLSTARSSNGGWNHVELGSSSFIFPSQRLMYFECIQRIQISAFWTFCRMSIFWMGNADTSWYESYEHDMSLLKTSISSSSTSPLCGRDGHRSNCSLRNSPRSRVAAFERPSAQSLGKFERASAEFGADVKSIWISYLGDFGYTYCFCLCH